MRSRYFLFVGVLSLLLSCAMAPEPANDTPLPPTPLQVTVQIDRSIDPVDGTTQVEWYFDITYKGENVGNAATVTVNSTNVPARLAFAWYYDLMDTEGAYYVPGNNFVIRVTYGGTTYTETVEAPGDITVSLDYRQVTWLHGGDSSVISTNYTFGTGTYQMPGSIGSLSSPHSIPASAYPQVGQSYDLNINVGTLKDGFGGLRGDSSYVWIFDYTRRRFTK